MPKGNATPATAPKIRGTIASSPNLLALVVATMGYLAERGNAAAVQAVSKDLSNGALPEAFKGASDSVQKMLFENVENPIDVDGKALYVGMHPFKANTFGVYRTELRDQHRKNQTVLAQVGEKATQRKALRAQKEAEKKAKAAERAQKALERANAAQAKAEKIAKKYNINFKALKTEMNTKSEADEALASIGTRPAAEAGVTAGV